MKQGTRFFIIFAIQGVMVYVMFLAMEKGNNDMITFAAGAAMMTFVLMLIIWLMSVISRDINSR